MAKPKAMAHPQYEDHDDGSKKMKPIIVKHPGSLKEAADRAHEGIVEYAEKHRHDKGDPAIEKKADLYLNVFRPASEKRHREAEAKKGK